MPCLEQWQEMWKGLGVSAADLALFHELLAHYSEKHRSYHTPRHLDECFVCLPLFSSFAERPYEIELALWFHDSIYDTKRQDHEEKSAEWAKAEALRAGLSNSVAGRVYELVMVTIEGLQNISGRACFVPPR